MINRIRVKPREGVLVRQPAPPYAPYPTEGANVPEDSYHLRRIADGDLIRVEESAAPNAQREPLVEGKSTKGGAR